MAENNFIVNNKNIHNDYINKFNFPRLLVIILLGSRASIDVFGRNLSFLKDTSENINLLGSLNIILFVFSFILIFINEKKIIKFNASLFLFTVFIFFSIFSILFTKNLLLSLRGLFTIGSYFGIYVLIFCFFRSKILLNSILNMLILSMIIPLLFGVYQVISGSGNIIISPGLNRIFGTVFHPSVFAMYLTILFPLSIFRFYYSQEIFKKIFYLLLIILITMSILFSYTRIAWLGLMIGIFGMLLNFKKFKLLVIFGFLCIILLMFFGSVIIDRVSEAFIINNGQIQFSELGSVAWRFQQWNLAIDVIKINFFTGIGLWNFPLFSSYNSTPHNDYLRVFAELGLFGFLSYLALLLFPLNNMFLVYQNKRNNIKNIHFAGTVFITIIIYLLFGLTDNPIGLPVVSWYFWSLVAVGELAIKYNI